MRIVHLTRDVPPAASGIGDHAARLARECAALGEDCVVVCSSPADPIVGVDVRPTIARWDGRGIGAIAQAVRAAAPDVVVWHYNPFQIGRRGVAPSAGALARTLAAIAPLVVVAHELWYPWGRNGLRGLVWSVAQRIQFRGVAAAARAILVTTDARRAALVRRFPGVALGVIPAGPTVEPSASPMPKTSAAFVVAHLGAIGEGRNLSPALDAIAALRAGGLDVRLVLAGRTGVAPPRAEGVSATGPLDHAALSATLAAADAYLFAEPTGPTSRKTSLLSALAHGLPIVAYDGPDAEPHFRDEENLLIVQPDAGSIAPALRRLAGDAALRERLGAASKRMAAQRYSWRAIAETVRDAAVRASATSRQATGA